MGLKVSHTLLMSQKHTNLIKYYDYTAYTSIYWMVKISIVSLFSRLTQRDERDDYIFLLSGYACGGIKVIGILSALILQSITILSIKDYTPIAPAPGIL